MTYTPTQPGGEAPPPPPANPPQPITMEELEEALSGGAANDSEV
jgi:hypothetical protein